MIVKESDLAWFLEVSFLGQINAVSMYLTHFVYIWVVLHDFLKFEFLVKVIRFSWLLAYFLLKEEKTCKKAFQMRKLSFSNLFKLVETISYKVLCVFLAHFVYMRVIWQYFLRLDFFIKIVRCSCFFSTFSSELKKYVQKRVSLEETWWSQMFCLSLSSIFGENSTFSWV